MKILLVSQFYYPERFSVTDIAESFVKAGHDVTVLTGKPNYGYQRIVEGYEKVKYEEINGVKVHRVNLYPRKYSRLSIIRNYLSFHRNAKRFVRHWKEEFDVVMSVSLSPVISISPALLYAKKHNVRCMLYCQDLWPESTVVTHAVRKNSLMYKVLYLWSKSIYKRCDKIVISSPSFKEYFENVLDIHDKGFRYINQPIILSKGKEEPITYSNEHNILYAGNIGKLQLTDLLVESMKYVKTPDVKLHLLGMGSELEFIKNKIKAEHLEDKVIYEGAFPIEKAERFYHNIDSFIVALKNEGYVGRTIPNKAIQCMSYGKPIICIASADTEEVLKKAKGSTFAGENAEEIAKAIDEMCSLNKAQRDELGSNNLDYYNKNFTAEILSNQLLEELTELKK